jgi:WD40 repeat protein
VELEQQLLRQDPSLSAPVGREVSAVCPYRGLLPYDAEDADTFFGREDDVAACLRRLRDGRVLAVVGPSGIGKSSLVRAGVVASLLQGGTPVLVTTPGAHPMDSLTGLKARGRQTLVVDQAEEAVTVGTDPGERERYFAALAAHVGAGGALVLSLRADHLGDLAPYPDIARVLEDGLYLLGPMAEPDLRSAIEGPARRAGLRLEPGLVDLLVREVEGEPAALPMLSHVLRETWERREGPTLTVEGYGATGGIRYAVSQSAEKLYDAMDQSQRTQLRSLLLRLVMPTEDGDPVRARVPRAKIAVDDAHARLVERLVHARLVSIDGDTVQIAHEALVRVWPRLRGWLDDDVDGQRLFRHLAGAADAWDAMGRPDSELYRGARLSRIREWRDRSTPDLDDTETAYLAASVALSETEQRAAETRIAQERRVNRRLRGALAGVGVLLVLTMVAGVVAVRSADRASRDRDRAEAAADLADARRAGAASLVQEDSATALLLAVSALQADPSPESWDTLDAALTRTRSLVSVREAGGSVVSLAVSGDGALVAASLPGEGEGVQLFDAATLEPVAFDDDIAASAVTFSPNGKVMAVAVNMFTGSSASPRIDKWPIRLYDIPGRQPAQRQLGGLRPGSAVEYSLGFSRNGKRLAAVVHHFDSTRGRWDAQGAAMVWDVRHPSRPVFSAAVPLYAVATLSPDGRHLYAATEGRRSVRVYEVDAGELIRSTGSPVIRRSGATATEVSPDGATLAVGAGNEVFRFDATTLRVAGPALREHTGEIRDLEFSHRGDLLLSASRDRTAIVWDSVSGALLNQFEEHNNELWGAAFGADDQTVYTSSFDGRILAWDLTGAGRTSTWVERACETAGRNLTRDEWRRFFPNKPYDVTCPQWPPGT